MNDDLQNLRERLLNLAVAAYDKGLTHGKKNPIELAELYLKYVTGVLAE